MGARNVVCENRGSGVGAMVQALNAAGLRDPEFEDKIATFRATFFNAPIPTIGNRREGIVSLLWNQGDLSAAELSERLQISVVAPFASG